MTDTEVRRKAEAINRMTDQGKSDLFEFFRQCALRIGWWEFGRGMYYPDKEMCELGRAVMKRFDEEAEVCFEEWT